MSEKKFDALDETTGLPRLLSRKCATCIYRPSIREIIGDDRVRELQQKAVEDDTAIICHSTLKDGPYNEKQAVCRGFWDVARKESATMRLAEHFGGPVEVEPPTHHGEPGSDMSGTGRTDLE